MLLAATQIKTTGINWESYLAISLTVVTLISILVGFVVKAADRRAKKFTDDLGNAIGKGLESFRKEYFDPMNLRLARIEGRLMGQDAREQERRNDALQGAKVCRLRRIRDRQHGNGRSQGRSHA